MYGVVGDDRMSYSAFDIGWGIMKASRQATMRDYDKNRQRFARNLIEEGVTPRAFDGYAGAGGDPNVLGGWSQGPQERGWDVATLEIDPQGWYKPTFADSLKVSADDILEHFGGEAPHLYCASPPCEGFSIAGAISANWDDWNDEKKAAFNRARRRGDKRFFDDPNVGPTPASDKAKLGRELLLADLQRIADLREVNPDMLAFIENPTGMMRYQPELGAMQVAQPLPYDLSSYDYPDVAGVKRPNLKRGGKQPPMPSITHSSYSGPMSEKLGGMGALMPGVPKGHLPSRKPTDLFGHHGMWEPRPPTKVNVHPKYPLRLLQKPTKKYPKGRKRPKSPGHAGLFHQVAERGAKTGTQGHSEGWTDPVTGKHYPTYWVRSLIPAELSRDVTREAERWIGLDRESSSRKGRR